MAHTLMGPGMNHTTRILTCRAAVMIVAGALSSAGAASPPAPDHVVIVIEENHSFAQVIGNSGAPYMNFLAGNGATFTSFYAITHPSQPNYIQFFSGDNQGVTDNTVPAPGAPFTTPNFGAALLASGATFVGYCDGLPGPGSTVSSSGAYVRKHNPWVNWQGSGTNQLPAALNQPFTAFPTDFSILPRVSIVVPDLNHDMHDGTIAQADAWLEANLGAYAQWAMENNSLLIVTWDEDESASRNRIPTIFYGPMVKTGERTQTWTLHDLFRTVGDLYGAAPSGLSAKATPIVGAFATDPALTTRTFRRGAAGYTGAHDTWIDQSAPAAAHDSDTIIVTDGSPLRQALIRFEDVFGFGPGQVPQGATILAAKLSLLTGPSSANGDLSSSLMSVHRMLTPWPDGATWNSMVGGISTNGVEAAAAYDYRHLPNTLDTWCIFDVTETVQAWSTDPAGNHGWAVMPAGTDGWRWMSSETSALADRPVLEITYQRCPSDFNADLFVSGEDFDAFVDAFVLGDAAADFDGNGFVSGDDFDGFTLAFIAGC